MKLSNLFSIIALQLLFTNVILAANNGSIPNNDVIIPENAKLSGKVVDQNNNPAVGAWVIIKELGTGTITDSSGNFILIFPAGTYTVHVGHIGCQTKVVEFSLAADAQKTENFRLDCIFFHLEENNLQMKMRENTRTVKKLSLEDDKRESIPRGSYDFKFLFRLYNML